jgi:hypothetical protein
MDVFTIAAWAGLFISGFILGYSLRASISAAIDALTEYGTARPEATLQPMKLSTSALKTSSDRHAAMNLRFELLGARPTVVLPDDPLKAARGAWIEDRAVEPARSRFPNP